MTDGTWLHINGTFLQIYSDVVVVDNSLVVMPLVQCTDYISLDINGVKWSSSYNNGNEYLYCDDQPVEDNWSELNAFFWECVEYAKLVKLKAS